MIFSPKNDCDNLIMDEIISVFYQAEISHINWFLSLSKEDLFMIVNEIALGFDVFFLIIQN